MKRIAQSLSSAQPYAPRFICLNRPTLSLAAACRHIHTSPPKPATVAPITASAPPPPPPQPSAEHVDARVARRRKQAELLKRGQDLRAVSGGKGGGSAGSKRFWKNVNVVKADEGLQIYLDKHPIRTPSKQILTVPHNRPHLATAIALEWDLLVSAQQALRHHLIPLTSLVSRALDIENEDAKGKSVVRDQITTTLMRYLETDSLLCWAPENQGEIPGYETHVDRVESLRSIQRRTAEPIIAFLTERVWPGIQIIPVLDDGSIMPKQQPAGTNEVIQGWIAGLPPFELAGLERAVLAGKGLLGGVRLLVEWSTELKHLREGWTEAEKYDIDLAERVASLEVTYQTDMWGMVEDSHDVQKEDLRRQLGSVILLVAGEES